MESTTNLIEKKESFTNIYLSKILKGDRFIFTDACVHDEFYNKPIEILEVIKENSSFRVSVDGEEYPIPFTDTMFENCILIR